MNKLKFLFTLLCAVVGVGSQTVAQVTTLDEISNSKVYTIQCGRGYMPNGDGVAQMYGTNNVDNAAKWAFVKSPTLANTYYIYSADQSKFLKSGAQNTNVYSSTISGSFTLTENNGTFIIASKETTNWLQFGGSKQYQIADASWKTKDDGNQWTLTEAGDFTQATDVLNTITAYESVADYIAVYNNLNLVGGKRATEEQKTQLQQYIDAKDGVSCKTLIDALETVTLSNDKKYNVYTTRGNLYTNGSVSSANRNNASEWAVLKYQDNDHYYFYDVTNKKFLGTANLNSLANPDNYYQVELWGSKPTEFKFTSMGTNKLLQMDGTPTLMITSTWDTKDAGDTWFIKEVGDFDSSEAMTLINNFEDVKTKLAAAIATASALPVGTAVGYYANSLTSAITAAQNVHDSETSTKEDYSAAIATLNQAVADALILPETSKYYFIQNANPAFFEKQNVNKGMYQNNNAPGWNSLNKTDLNFVWTWTPKGAGWAVQNVGGGKYLDTTSAMNASEPSGVISLVWLAAGEWNIKATGGAVMHALNHQSGAGVSGDITSWEGGAGSCSAWSIIELTAEDITALAEAQIVEFAKLGGSGIGYYIPTEEAYNAAENAKTALEADKTDMTKVVALYAAIKAAKESATVKLPATGAFYRIKGTASGNYISSTRNDNNKYNIVDKSTDEKGTIWYLDENSTLINFATGLGFKDTSLGAAYNETFNKWTFAAAAAGVPSLSLKSDATGVGPYLCDWTSGATDRMSVDAAANRTAWQIEEVTSLPVTIGSTGYASVNLPVATIIPEGVEAWVAGTEEDGKLPLSKIKDTNILPANCAVILYTATPATYNFTITTSDATVSNTFSGTVAAQALAEGINTMVLGNDATSGVGLYNYAPTSDADKYIPGFKMYYETTASEIRAQWNDMTTAIEAAKNNTMREGEMYNLNGQQVTKANGLVIVNGRKFIVK